MIEIKRWTDGDVIYKCDAITMKDAVERAVKEKVSLNRAYLNGAYLDGAYLNGASLNRASLNDASLNDASLDDAYLNDASLNRASLNRASLNRASLDGASLNDASLDGAYLLDSKCVATLGQPDGWFAFSWVKDNTVMVQVGCKSFTISEGREYWRGKENRREVMAALDYAEAISNIRGWIK